MQVKKQEIVAARKGRKPNDEMKKLSVAVKNLFFLLIGLKTRI
jgi:hypothetical protein